MPSRDFDRWVVLSLRPRQGDLWLEYSDETATRRLVPDETGLPDPMQWRGIPLVRPTPLPIDTRLAPTDSAAVQDLSRRYRQLYVPADVESLLRSGFADITDTRYHYRPDTEPSGLGVPWVLPVFLAPPYGMEAAPWEPLIEAVLFEQPELSDRCVLLRLARPTWKRSSPIKLPLTLFDNSDPPGRWLAGVRTRRWYANNAEMREVGVRLEPYYESRRRPANVSPGGAHIVLERTRRPTRQPASPRPLRPRNVSQKLAVVFSDAPLDEALSGGLGNLPESASLLMQQGQPGLLDPEIVSTVTEIVYALVHDFALHEVLWILRRIGPPHHYLLASDPAANQALRLSRTMRQVVDETLALTLPTAGGEADGALTRARSEVARLAFDFTRESRGLTELAHLLAGPVRRARKALQEAGRGARPRDETRLDGAETPRRADIALEAYNAFGVLTPMNEFDRKMPLRPGWSHRLRVHIGQRDAEFSAVEGDVPAIDPLLPELVPEEAHEIDVVVFEKSFTLLSPGVQTLRLPHFGGSTPVYFRLRTPEKSGPADFRVALYHANNLLQSFVLEAEIAEQTDRSARATAQVRVRLSSSGTARFANIDPLGERALSLALNEDGQGGTHTLMIKKDRLREAILLTEAQVAKYMARFRGLLGEASKAKDASSERLFPVGAAASLERVPQFEAYLRQLAKLGQDIWLMLVQRRGVNTNILRALQRGSGETLQFVRHGRMLPFPWQVIYDYKLPEGDRFGASSVCLANTPVIRQLERQEVGCPHHPGKDVVCIEGFWSVRHRFEQLIEERDTRGEATATDEDRVTKIEVPRGNPLVCLGVGHDDLPARRLRQRLEEILDKADLRILTDADPLLEDILWKDTTRPAVLIVLSHLQPADETRNLPARVCAVVAKPPAPENVPSATRLLQQKLHLKEWTAPPRTFVLLMACESAQVHLEALTNLVDTFFGVGAAAVAGAECDVFSDLAADFAAEIAGGLSTGKRALGDLVRDYTARMLREWNPLPFAFPVFGSAGLTIAKK